MKRRGLCLTWLLAVAHLAYSSLLHLDDFALVDDANSLEAIVYLGAVAR